MLRYGLLGVQACLGLLCLWLVWGTARAVVSAGDVPDPRLPALEPPGERSESLEHYEAIAARDLFARATFVAPPEPIDEDIAESSLRLQLLGTAAAGEPSLSVAVLIDDAGEHVTVGVGEIVSGAEVVSIEPERIVIRNKGQLEEVRLSEQEAPRRATSARQRARARGQPRGRARPAPRGRDAGGLSGRLEQLRRASERTEAAAGTPQNLLSEARVSPSYDPDGRHEGLRVNRVEPGGMLAGMGLQEGDVIRSLNGQPLGSPSEGIRLMRSSSPQDAVAMEIEREGQTLMLQHDPGGP